MPCERKHLEAIAHAVSAAANRECLVDCCCPICCATGNVTSAVLEALAACDESPWRSMESAPKDGTEFDVHDGAERVPDCRWCTAHCDWEHWGHDGFDGMMWVILDAPPLYWMPLPAAPEGQKP